MTEMAKAKQSPRFRELSYSSPDDPLWRRWLMQSVEELSGRQKLLPIYKQWQEEYFDKAPDEIAQLLRLLDMPLSVRSGKLPVLKEGEGAVLIANHPFGIPDGLAMLALAESLGRPFKIFLNADLLKIPEVHKFALAVDFEPTKQALKTNLASRGEALEAIKRGEVIAIFPGGGVATAKFPLYRETEEFQWKTFAAKLIQTAKCPVVPIFFPGRNGFLFHFTSGFSTSLRLSLLISEFGKQMNKPIDISIGETIYYKDHKDPKDRVAMIQFLYDEVFKLGAGN